MVDGFKLEELPDRRPYQEPPDRIYKYESNLTLNPTKPIS